tara:strand:- start:2664 stop:3944 length:1281 start_codon:yes stop_codon:yes gene_type:complete
MYKKILSLPLYFQILIALVFAVILGSITNSGTVLLGINVYNFYDFIGNLFLNALKMISIPLIIASIISGISNLGSGHAIGRLGIKVIIYYLFTSFIAIIVGLVLVNIIKPGIVSGTSVSDLLGVAYDTTKLIDHAKLSHIDLIYNIFLQLVPSNIFLAASNGQLLGLIFFSIMFGYFILKIDAKHRNTLKNFWSAVFDAMMLFTMWIMNFAPIGVFGLVAKAISSAGFSTFMPVLKFFITVLLGLSVHFLISLSLLLWFVGKVHPLKHLKAMLPAIITAFSTASSSATLPITIKCAEKNSGVSNKTTSFVLPLGATVNMDGTALYECIAVIFIAQAYGIDLSFSSQFMILVMALLTSIGVAGIPAASLVAITLILTAVGLPLEAVGLIMITDRILDMCRTSVNIYSDSCGAVIIARLNGEKTNIAR